MHKPLATFAIVTLALTASGCSSSSAQVDLKEPKRVLGRESDVIVNAQIFAERLGSNTNVPFTYEIENLRAEAIAVAEVAPTSSYDQTTGTITLNVGAEIPSSDGIPRLLTIAPGQKKSFQTSVRPRVLVTPAAGPFSQLPRFLRIKVNFLGNVEPFRMIPGISEQPVPDPKLAESLFSVWVEQNEGVTTNAIPIVWTGDMIDREGADVGRRTRRF